MQIKLNESNISEDWGWFVDTETLLINQVDLVKQINQAKKKYNNINKLEKITEEDEYHYHDIESLENTESLVTNIGSLMEPCTTIIIVTTLTFLLFAY
jgi:hypothetical protein